MVVIHQNHLNSLDAYRTPRGVHCRCSRQSLATKIVRRGFRGPQLFIPTQPLTIQIKTAAVIKRPTLLISSTSYMRTVHFKVDNGAKSAQNLLQLI